MKIICVLFALMCTLAHVSHPARSFTCSHSLARHAKATFVVLTSSTASSVDEKSKIAQLTQLLNCCHIVFEELDCIEEKKNVRKCFFEVNTVRGNYQQILFMKDYAVQYIDSFGEFKARTQALVCTSQMRTHM